MKDTSFKKKKRKSKNLPEFRATNITEAQTVIEKKKNVVCPVDPAEANECESCQ